MGDVIASENIYGEDASGKRRLLYLAGDAIPEEEAKRLGLTGEAKAKRKPADKAAEPEADKAG